MFGIGRRGPIVADRPRQHEGLEYAIGLDLGQVAQVSGLALVETTDGGRTSSVRALRRYPPGTPYPEIAATVRDLLARPPVALTDAERAYRRRPQLVVGVTAVGVEVGQTFADLDAEVRFVAITAGDQLVAGRGGVMRVPKRELVGTLQMGLQAQRVVVSRKLPDASALLDELQGYTTRVRLGDEGDDWRREGGRLDDLVLALALGTWALGRAGRPADFELLTLDEEAF